MIGMAPKRKPDDDKHEQDRLDDALNDTFPASDPVSFLQPGPSNEDNPADAVGAKPASRRRKAAKPARPGRP